MNHTRKNENRRKRDEVDCVWYRPEEHLVIGFFSKSTIHEDRRTMDVTDFSCSFVVGEMEEGKELVITGGVLTLLQDIKRTILEWSKKNKEWEEKERRPRIKEREDIQDLLTLLSVQVRRVIDKVKRLEKLRIETWSSAELRRTLPIRKVLDMLIHAEYAHIDGNGIWSLVSDRQGEIGYHIMLEDMLNVIYNEVAYGVQLKDVTAHMRTLLRPFEQRRLRYSNSTLKKYVLALQGMHDLQNWFDQITRSDRVTPKTKSEIADLLGFDIWDQKKTIVAISGRTGFRLRKPLFSIARKYPDFHLEFLDGRGCDVCIEYKQLFRVLEEYLGQETYLHGERILWKPTSN